MTFTIQNDIRAQSNRLVRVDPHAILAGQTDDLLDELTGMATESIRSLSPVKTGKLRDETTSEIEPDPNGGGIGHVAQPSTVFWKRIGRDYPYARFLVDGTKYIDPRTYPQEGMAQVPFIGTLTSGTRQIALAVAEIFH